MKKSGADDLAIVYVPRPQFGVSHTEDGRKMLTPFSSFGRCYPYSARLRGRFSAAITTQLWVVATIAAGSFAWQAAYKVDPVTFFVDFIVLLIFADAARVILTLVMFSGVPGSQMCCSLRAVPVLLRRRIVIRLFMLLAIIVEIGVIGAFLLLPISGVGVDPIRLAVSLITCHGTSYGLALLRTRRS